MTWAHSRISFEKTCWDSGRAHMNIFAEDKIQQGQVHQTRLKHGCCFVIRRLGRGEREERGAGVLRGGGGGARRCPDKALMHSVVVNLSTWT